MVFQLAVGMSIVPIVELDDKTEGHLQRGDFACTEVVQMRIQKGSAAEGQWHLM